MPLDLAVNLADAPVEVKYLESAARTRMTHNRQTKELHLDYTVNDSPERLTVNLQSDADLKAVLEAHACLLDQL